MGFGDVSQILLDSLTSVFDWFHSIFDAIDGSVGAFAFLAFMFFIVARLLIPLIGHAVSAGQSDRVRSTTTTKKGE